ncbi:unnamed protein product [Darwinula stevensoni]|uniref:C2H2-type domain-containing protein n=1 Tax=Darwinula stevensoni TaxID=69355 RepID=A0A7R8ZYI5_9CRUS|nr:unnamed protein product [Darwinula stevensoni]CAG0881575.1 unnamed protein product [Darwinula stevensoni]
MLASIVQSFVCPSCHDETQFSEEQEILKHLLCDHKLVIAERKLIADLPRYLSYWRKRFQDAPLETFCPVIRTNSDLSPEIQEDYYLLCDALPEDREIRVTLQKEKLKWVLEQYEKERNDPAFSHSCLFCKQVYVGDRAELLNHLAFDHHFSIGHPDNIVFLKEFLNLIEQKLTMLRCLYCEKDFRDWSILKEHMRKKLHKKINPRNQEYDKFYLINYLEFGKSWQDVQKWVLEQYEKERNDPAFSHSCLFCKQVYVGDRAELLNHLAFDHHFSIGHPDNIVFLKEFLNLIEQKLTMLRCLYCEKDFRDWSILKEHMRKKLHKKINPRNQEYDKFYLINYLEFGKSWQDVQDEEDGPEAKGKRDDDSDWSDWGEGTKSINILCLFCDMQFEDSDTIILHMKQEHSFDFTSIQGKEMEFYDKIKIINYIRRQVHQRCCIICEEQFECHESLLEHMSTAEHFQVPPSSQWNQPQYYFPTKEDDNLLCILEDDEKEHIDDVIPENLEVSCSILSDEQLRKTLQ